MRLLILIPSYILFINILSHCIIVDIFNNIYHYKKYYLILKYSFNIQRTIIIIC